MVNQNKRKSFKIKLQANNVFPSDVERIVDIYMYLRGVGVAHDQGYCLYISVFSDHKRFHRRINSPKPAKPVGTAYCQRALRRLLDINTLLNKVTLYTCNLRGKWYIFGEITVSELFLSPVRRMIYSIRKEFAPLEQILFFIELTPFQKGFGAQ